MSKQNKTPATTRSADTKSQSDGWYRQVAGATLSASAALAGGAHEAAANIVLWENQESVLATTDGVDDLQPVIYLNFLTGETEIGSANQLEPIPPTIDPQFGVARFGDIAGSVTFGSGDLGLNRQFLASNSAFPPGGTGDPIYELPFRLAAGDVIGSAEQFAVGEDGSIHTMAQNGYESYWGHWRQDPGPAYGYLGLRFSENDGEDYYYGWAEVTVATDYNITLHRMAYNDAVNEQILAGQVNYGDYNEDGTVDAADYTVWRDTLGSEGNDLAADGIKDGIINETDYALWKSYFGDTTLTPIGAGVPEPSTMLLVLGAAGLPAYRARRRNQPGKTSNTPQT